MPMGARRPPRWWRYALFWCWVLRASRRGPLEPENLALLCTYCTAQAATALMGLESIERTSRHSHPLSGISFAIHKDAST